MKKNARLFVIVLAALMVLPLSAPGANPGSGLQKKTILVIESYHAGYAWDISYKKGIEKILGQDFNLVYFEMDTKRIAASKFDRRADMAVDTYRRVQPDLVMLGDDNALRLVGPRLAGTGTPLVYFGINNNPRDYQITSFENMTGVLERPLAKRSIVYLSELIKPWPKRILILFDSGVTSQAAVREMFSDRFCVRVGGVQVDLKLIVRLADWKEAVLTAKKRGYGAIVVGLYHTIVDQDGNHVPAPDILDWTSRNTPVPPFGFWSFAVGRDRTVGGLVLFGETQGEAAARIARQILAGVNPSEIRPVVGKKGRFYFSRSQLKKWDLVLPPDIAAKADMTD